MITMKEKDMLKNMFEQEHKSTALDLSADEILSAKIGKGARVKTHTVAIVSAAAAAILAVGIGVYALNSNLETADPEFTATNSSRSETTTTTTTKSTDSSSSDTETTTTTVTEDGAAKETEKADSDTSDSKTTTTVTATWCDDFQVPETTTQQTTTAQQPKEEPSQGVANVSFINQHCGDDCLIIENELTDDVGAELHSFLDKVLKNRDEYAEPYNYDSDGYARIDAYDNAHELFNMRVTDEKLDADYLDIGMTAERLIKICPRYYRKNTKVTDIIIIDANKHKDAYKLIEKCMSATENKVKEKLKDDPYQLEVYNCDNGKRYTYESKDKEKYGINYTDVCKKLNSFYKNTVKAGTLPDGVSVKKISEEELDVDADYIRLYTLDGYNTVKIYVSRDDSSSVFIEVVKPWYRNGLISGLDTFTDYYVSNGYTYLDDTEQYKITCPKNQYQFILDLWDKINKKGWSGYTSKGSKSAYYGIIEEYVDENDYED